MTYLDDLTNPLRRESDRGRIVAKLRAVAESAVDVTAPQSALTVDTAGNAFGIRLAEPIIAPDGVYHYFAGHLNRTSIRNLATRLDIPPGFLDRLIRDHPDVADYDINTLADRDPRTALYRLWHAEDGWMLRAILSDTYRAFDNVDTLMAVTRGLQDADMSLDDCEVDADWTNERFRLRIAVPQIQLLVPDLLAGYRWPYSNRPERGIHDPAAGGEVPPVLWAGIEVSNSETGGGANTITPRAVVQVCRNGLTQAKDMLRSVHLGGRLDSGIIAWSGETHRRALELLASQVADATRRFLSVGYLEETANSMRAAKGIDIASPTAAAHVVQMRLGFTDAETASVLDAFMRGGDSSVLGLGQAVTAAAQASVDGDRQSEMEAMFWAIVEQPHVYAGAVA